MAEARLSPLEDSTAFLNDWERLLPLAGNATFFQSPAWMNAWLEDTPNATSLHKIEVRGDNGLELLGVIGRLQRRMPPVIGATQARLHEFGAPEHDAIYVEYNDFLVARNAANARKLALTRLVEDMQDVESFVFRNITPPCVAAIESIAGDQSFGIRILNDQPVYVIDLAKNTSNEASVVDNLSKSLASKIRRAVKHYSQKGALTCREAETQSDVESAWNRLKALHEAGWRRKGQAGVFTNDRLIAFHDRLRGLAPDTCKLFEVFCGEEPIGVLYNFVDGDRVINYQSGFKFETDNKLTPGYVCHALAAQHYQDRGFATYDFLAGDVEYKRRFGIQETSLQSIALDRAGWRQSLRRLVRRTN